MKPLIAVSCHELDAPELARGMEALQGDRGATFMLLWELYAGIFDGVARAGGVPVSLSCTHGTEDALLAADRFDGFLLSGGADLDPARYGQAMGGSRNISPRRDAFEAALLEAALKRRKPVFAICRGLQLVNAVLGGTLIQDLASAGGPAAAHPICDFPSDKRVHRVDLEPGSLAASLLGPSFDANSLHHQGADRIGRGLRVTGRAPDGVVEALEGTGPSFLLGVQWHPESLAAEDPAQQRLFDAFVRACS